MFGSLQLFHLAIFCQEMPRREVVVELNTVSRVLGFTWLMRSLNIESFFRIRIESSKERELQNSSYPCCAGVMRLKKVKLKARLSTRNSFSWCLYMCITYSSIHV